MKKQIFVRPHWLGLLESWLEWRGWMGSVGLVGLLAMLASGNVWVGRTQLAWLACREVGRVGAFGRVGRDGLVRRVGRVG